MFTLPLKHVNSDVHGQTVEVAPYEFGGRLRVPVKAFWEFQLAESDYRIHGFTIDEDSEYTVKKLNGQWRITSEQSSLADQIEKEVNSTTK